MSAQSKKEKPMTKQPHILIFNPDQWRGDVMGHVGNTGAVTPFVDQWVETDAVSYTNAFCQAPVCTPSRCSFATGLYPHVRGHRSLNHMLHADHGEKNMFQLLRENGYFVWWGGKNDLVTADDGPEANSDIFYQADDGFFERHNSRPQSDMHRSDQSFRGPKGSDTYYSFLKGELKKDETDDYYMDDDWQKVLGAIEFIENAPDDKPLCIYLPILFPHPPYGVESEFYDLMRDVELPPRRKVSDAQMARKSEMLREIRAAQGLTGWDETRWDELRRTYYGMIARVDRQFSMLIDALKRKGFYDDTAVFLFSDHGDYTGDYDVVEKSQNCFEDPLVRVPLVVKPPSGWQVSPGKREGVIAELVDMTATVFELAGVDPGYDHFGRSLRKTIADPNAPHKEYAFCEGGRRPDEEQICEKETFAEFGPDPSVCLYYPRVNIQVTNPDAHERAVMIRSLDFKYIRRMTGDDEFYDLQNDAHEVENRIHDPKYAAQISEMREGLLSWYLDTSDIVPKTIDSRWRTPRTGADQSTKAPASIEQIRRQQA